MQTTYDITTFTGSDLTHPERAYDFGNLPYEDESFDHVVFDPPYVHDPGEGFQKENSYRNNATLGAEELHSPVKGHEAVVERRNGVCWLK